jgi:hypothetical protein
MTCEEARQLIGADPENASPELLAHLKSCAECQAYRQQMLAFNGKIRQALELDWQKVQKAAPPSAPPAAAEPTRAPTATTPSAGAAPATGATPATALSASTAPTAGAAPATAARAATGAAPTPDGAPTSTPGPGPTPASARSNVTPFRRRSPPSVPKQKRPRLVAFAASVAAAAVAGLVLWLSRPPESLAAEIVKHVEREPNSWSKTEPVAGDHLKAVLRKSGVKLGPGMESIVYASSCWFRGHFVPHFVVMTKDGPVTVMILMNEKVSGPQQFDEDGFSGLLVPASTGSVAVLSRTPMSLDQPASEVVKALQAADQGNASTALPSRL